MQKSHVEKIIQFFETHDWTKHKYARDAMGGAVNYTSRDATCFCLMGASLRVADSTRDTFDFEKFFIDTFHMPPTQYNDYGCASKEELIEKLKSCLMKDFI